MPEAEPDGPACKETAGGDVVHGCLHSVAGAAAPGLGVEQGMRRRLMPGQQALDADLYMAVTCLADAWPSVHGTKHS